MPTMKNSFLISDLHDAFSPDPVPIEPPTPISALEAIKSKFRKKSWSTFRDEQFPKKCESFADFHNIGSLVIRDVICLCHRHQKALDPEI